MIEHLIHVTGHIYHYEFWGRKGLNFLLSPRAKPVLDSHVSASYRSNQSSLDALYTSATPNVNRLIYMLGNGCSLSRTDALFSDQMQDIRGVQVSLQLCNSTAVNRQAM